MKSVVRLDAGGHSLGTGFLVSSDGFILTAGHVITDETAGEYFSAIEIVLPNGTHKLANVAMPASPDSTGQDYAILKVDGESKLPFIPLGSFSDAAPGTDATIIGYPFSAITVQDQRVTTKFCLSAMVSASDLATILVTGTQRVGNTYSPFNKNVKVDVVYFQGPSVKGISGSPLISRETGKVIGIVTLKLSGIGTSLGELKKETAKGLGSGINISGLDPGLAINQILTVLDDQLANGLGAATGIDDPAYALKKAQREYGRTHPK